MSGLRSAKVAVDPRVLQPSHTPALAPNTSTQIVFSRKLSEASDVPFISLSFVLATFSGHVMEQKNHPTCMSRVSVQRPSCPPAGLGSPRASFLSCLLPSLPFQHPATAAWPYTPCPPARRNRVCASCLSSHTFLPGKTPQHLPQSLGSFSSCHE